MLQGTFIADIILFYFRCADCFRLRYSNEGGRIAIHAGSSKGLA